MVVYAVAMPPRASIPRELRLLPFRGSDVVSRKLLTATALRGKAWTRLLPDIYIAADVPLDHRMWCYAASLAVRDRGAVSGLSALYLCGIDLLPRGGMPVEVTMHGTARLADTPHLTVVRSVLGTGDVVVGPVRFSTPVRTAFDLARRLPLTDAIIAIDAMLSKRLLTVDVLGEYCGARRRWPGGAAIPLVLDRIEPLTESPMETRLRLILVDGGLPRPTAQFRAYQGKRFLGRLDLAYPQWKVGIEYDGDQHRSRDVFREDVARLNKLRVAGWTVLRFTATDVFRNPGRIIKQVRAVIPE
jgi:hypothetical protein